MKIDTDAVLDFWFSDSITSLDVYKQRKEIWFTPSESFDLEIKRQFEPYIELAANEVIQDIADCPRKMLSRILILDQFPRNIYRGTPRAFAYDDKALSLTMKCLDTGIHQSFSFPEKLFVYIPLQHSEELEVQNLSVEIFQDYVNSAETESYRNEAESSLQFSKLHQDIIERSIDFHIEMKF